MDWTMIGWKPTRGGRRITGTCRPIIIGSGSSPATAKEAGTKPGRHWRLPVEPHFYQTWWFLALASIAIWGGGVGMARRAATRKYRRDLSRLEQQHAVERDRARIAQDIHDDLGAGLTQITLLGELARREPGDASAHLDRISHAARQLTRAMDEIVWAVDPQHDTLNGLMDYISAFAEDFLRVAGIRCRMDLPAALPQRRVDAELRYNLFLAVKEALNNVVKHAQATEVWLRLRVEEGGFTLVVEDNGCGCNGQGNGNGATAKAGAAQDRLATGSGLPNLQKRLHAVGGRCTVLSVPGEGTHIEMTIHLNDPVSPIVAIGQNGAISHEAQQRGILRMRMIRQRLRGSVSLPLQTRKAAPRSVAFA